MLERFCAESRSETGFFCTIGALIISIGFWGPLNYNYNKEPPKWYSIIIEAPIVCDRFFPARIHFFVFEVVGAAAEGVMQGSE